MLFRAPSHCARDSSSGVESRYIFSSAIICRQKFLERDMGSTSAASNICVIGMILTAEYSCQIVRLLS